METEDVEEGILWEVDLVEEEEEEEDRDKGLKEEEEMEEEVKEVPGVLRVLLCWPGTMA